MPESPAIRSLPCPRGRSDVAPLVLICLLALQPWTAAADELLLTSKFIAHPVGAPPGDVVVGDFDEDGRNEIALVGQAGSTTAVYLYQAQGSRWVPLPALTAGFGPVALVAEDLDGDGHVDLATANYSASSISVLRGLGNGSFQPKVGYSTASGPRSIATGDITGDGVLDLVTIGITTAISVLPGNGAGGFAARVDRSSGAELRGLQLHDFDGDGREDVVVLSRSGNSLLMHRSLGGGLLDVAQAYGGFVTPEIFALGDFDGDGEMDVVVAQGGAAPLVFLRGTAGFAFEPPIAVAFPGATSRLVAGHADADGFLDVLATSGCELVVLRGRGDGSFELPQRSPAGTGAGAVLLAELDGDPSAEVAVGYSGSGMLALYDVAPSGLIGSVEPDDELPGTTDLHLSDYDADGELDLIQMAAGLLETRRGLGGGAFAAPVVVAEGLTPWGYSTGFVDIGEFNGDGIPDIVGVRNIPDNDLEVVVFHGNGTTTDGGFGAMPQPLGVVSTHATSGSAVATLTVGDVNQDGRDDILVGRYSNAPHVIVFRQQVGGSFARTDLSLPDFEHAAIGAERMIVTDVDGDAVSDILIATPVKVAYMPGLGNGVFGTALYVDASPGHNPDIESFADLDGDGWMDVLSTNAGLGSWMRGLGTGGFAPTGTTFALPGPSRALQTLDVDRDGWLDVIAPLNAVGCISVFRARGDGTFESPRHVGAANGAVALAGGDLDGDGFPELLVGGSSSTVVLRNLASAVGVAPRPVTPMTGLALSSPFPNPMRNQALIDLSLPDGRPGEFQVLDIRGRIVHRVEIAGGTTGARRVELELPRGLAMGLYFGRLVHPAGTRSTKLVLQR